MAPAFAVGFEPSGWVGTLIATTPTGHGMQLAVNGMSGEEVFSNPGLSFFVIATWCAAGLRALLLDLRYQQNKS